VPRNEPGRGLFGRRRHRDGELEGAEPAGAGDEDARERERAAAERVARIAVLPLWTDTHCHLQYAADEADELATVERAVAAGVRRMICVGTDAASSARAIGVAVRRTASAGGVEVKIWATAGLHPHDASQGTGELFSLLRRTHRVRSGQASGPPADGGLPPRVVAIGECGLDYHYDYSPRPAQRAVFAAQVALANELGLALVVHTREAWEDTLAVLATEGAPARTVFHCFTGGPEEAKQCLATGAYLSFSGIATFHSAGEVREAVRLCPHDRLLIETDSPYLTPVPHRGRPNEPADVTTVGEAVARELDMSIEEVARLTTANAAAAFGLPG
jgi:TatD DNase family protein